VTEQTGAALELSTATDQLTSALALQATAPSEEHEIEVRRALGDYVTALGSNSTKMLAGGLVGVYGRLDQLTARFGEIAERIDYRFDAYGQELDAYRQQMQSLTALVEERLVRPFAEVVARVETLEYGYAELADRVDTALDPNTQGAKSVQGRLGAMERLVRRQQVILIILFVLILLLFAALISHDWRLNARLGA
jgi:hypothetical protein